MCFFFLHTMESAVDLKDIFYDQEMGSWTECLSNKILLERACFENWIIGQNQEVFLNSFGFIFKFGFQIFGFSSGFSAIRLDMASAC